VISPTNSASSITIVTLPLSRILRTASSGVDGCNVSSHAFLDPNEKIRLIQ
jgi:hypothetical protein